MRVHPGVSQMWKVNSLKDFLSKRSLKVEGNQETLVAHAFAAWEMKVPISKTSVQVDKEKRECYENLLQISTDGSPVVFLDPERDELNWLSKKRWN